MNYHDLPWTHGASKRSRLGDAASWAGLAMLEEAEARARVAAWPECHYTYVLIDPLGIPLYVGKGQDNRAFDHVAEHRHAPLRIKSHKYNAIGVILGAGNRVRYALPGVFATHADAIALEVSLISRIGRYYCDDASRRGPLTNQTSGGEGTPDLSPEARLARSLTLWGPSSDPERHAAWRFVSQIAPELRSNVLKPLDGPNGFRAKLKATRAPETRSQTSSSPGPTLRRATTVVAMAIASGSLLVPGNKISRTVTVVEEGKAPLRLVAENGALQDAVNALMLKVEQPSPLDPAEEVLVLCYQARSAALKEFGADQLISLGVLPPED